MIPKLEVVAGDREDRLMTLVKPHLHDTDRGVSGFAKIVKDCVTDNKVGMLSTFAEWGMSHPNPKTRDLCQQTLNIMRLQ